VLHRWHDRRALVRGREDLEEQMDHGGVGLVQRRAGDVARLEEVARSIMAEVVRATLAERSAGAATASR
jgi:hypothetical protein